jgi:hypothetical protein
MSHFVVDGASIASRFSLKLTSGRDVRRKYFELTSCRSKYALVVNPRPDAMHYQDPCWGQRSVGDTSSRKDSRKDSGDTDERSRCFGSD